MRKYSCYQVDAFTNEKLAGNPAGVVLNAGDLTAEEMQRIAREFNNSETAFLVPECGKPYDVTIHYFTPTKEVPICGHATIAAHYAAAVENHLNTCRIFQKTGAGVLPVDIIHHNGDYRIVMTQGKIEFGPVLDGKNLEKLLAALHLSQSDLLKDYPVQIVSTGHSKVMIGIRDSALLNCLQPQLQALEELSGMIQCNGYYVFTIDEAGSSLIHGRMFAPAIGIAEDPVTGNANGPLGAYLVHYGKVDCSGSEFLFQARQGEAMHRPGTIGVRVSIENGEPACVQVTGGAVIAFHTELLL